MRLRARYVAAGAAALAYLVASQWLMTRTPPPPWSAAALLGPMLALVALGMWRAGRRAWSLCVAAAVVALVVHAAFGDGFDAERLYLTEHVAFHIALAFGFGLTLRRGARPLISRLADRVHRGLTPAMEDYTRNVTVAWTAYFVAMAALSLGLYLGATFAVWATFANVGTPVALALMFGGEHLLRYRLHPDFERATMQDAIRAWAQARHAPHPGAEP